MSPHHHAHDHHDHGHGHAHEDHDHDPHHHHHGKGASTRRLTAALALLGSFAIAEGLGGLWAHSIALLAEAVHMLADSASLVLAIIAIGVARRPASVEKSYGHQRYQTLAAYTNGVALIVLTLWVVTEAVQRMLHPSAVNSVVMLGVALAGGAANLAALMVLSGKGSLNERGARAHVLSDLLGSLAAAAAACLIWAYGWVIADPLLSLLVSALIFRSGWAVTQEASHVLLQGAPTGFDADAVRRDLIGVQGVRDVHELHAWSLTGEAPIVTLHAALAEGTDRQQALATIVSRLRERFAVEHATVQIEEGVCVE